MRTPGHSQDAVARVSIGAKSSKGMSCIAQSRQGERARDRNRPVKHFQLYAVRHGDKPRHV
jgi:hypothetical protein